MDTATILCQDLLIADEARKCRERKMVENDIDDEIEEDHGNEVDNGEETTAKLAAVNREDAGLRRRDYGETRETAVTTRDAR